ncbi:hypothetical protein ES703_56429 [subsurface metagenome]
MKNLSAIRAIVRQMLSDEFVEGSEQDFEDDEIDLHIGEVVAEISERRPYVVKETLKTTEGSRELPISSIEDLLEIEKLEYPTGSDPRDYRNFIEIDADTIEIDTTLTPSADEDVYLYCRKLHQLTESASTLNPQLKRVLIDGSVAKVALSWINQLRSQVKEAIAKISDINTAIGNMTSATTGIEMAIKDLVEGRKLINKVNIGGKPQADYAAYAARELGNANSYLSQSQGYLRELTSRLSISGVINSYQTWANNKLTLYLRDLGRLARARTYTEYPKS